MSKIETCRYVVNGDGVERPIPTEETGRLVYVVWIDEDCDTCGEYVQEGSQEMRDLLQSEADNGHECYVEYLLHAEARRPGYTRYVECRPE